jgi:hypothetical protein
MTLDLQPSFGLAVTLGSILASVAVWAFFWWLSGHAKTGVRRPIRVVLVLAGVLYVALFLYTFLVPIDTRPRTRSAPALTPSTSVAALSPGELPLPTPPFVNNFPGPARTQVVGPWVFVVPLGPAPASPPPSDPSAPA